MSLREVQKPLKDRYREGPVASLEVEGDLDLQEDRALLHGPADP